jgi:voltage-gated potassium channel
MPSTQNPTKEKIHEVIFEADTPMGKLFDIILMVVILLSVFVVMLESVNSYEARFGTLFITLEWVFTFFFSIEYGLRLYCVYNPKKYALSFFGIIDLLAIIPTFLSLVITGSQYLIVIRALRLLRIFRIFKLVKFLNEGNVIVKALIASRAKILVFMLFILLLVTILGSLMYLIEAEYNQRFDSIPRSIYWAIVTLTTVGYGDISPSTSFGQFIAAFVMLLGYAVIAVPTGIVSAEFARAGSDNKTLNDLNTQTCRYCSREGHDNDAIHCKYCGELLKIKK